MREKVVVIGGSAGAVEGLLGIVAALPRDFPVPLLAVLHIGRHRSRMPELLSARGPLPSKHGEHGERIAPGRIYVAPSDVHMMLDGDTIRLNRGAREHHTRPAIDPLFRSAALSRGADVVGVLLSGWLDDGTAGLQAIEALGGTTVVQDPDEAQAPSMPLSALRHVRVHHRVRLAQMPELLSRLAVAASASAGDGAGIRRRAVHEHDLLLHRGDAMEHLDAIGRPSGLSCPDCGGGLWELADTKPLRYRCHTGHAFTIRTLQYAHGSVVDEALWGAVRALQSRSMILERMARMADESGDAAEAVRLRREVAETSGQAEALHALALKTAPEPAGEAADGRANGLAAAP